MTPKKGDHWQHFKGRKYEILWICMHTETKEEMVVYREVDETGNVWVRPMQMFLEIPTVKPTPKAQYNCLHSMQDHFIIEENGESVMYCQDCIDSAKNGRFILLPK